jgi:23S rRNA (adenine2503-C2)-methyltransferase
MMIYEQTQIFPQSVVTPSVADIASMTADEIASLMQSFDEKSFRAKQIFGWLHAGMASDWGEMTNLPKSLREKLARFPVSTALRLVDTLASHNLKPETHQLHNTTKYLFATSDNNIIESVYMSYNYGGSVCVSSQAGCKMGCAFCASGLNGLERNLTAGEMCGQVYGVRKLHEDVTRVVVMGSGEPLDNFDNVIRFYRLLTHEEGLNVGGRHVTVSTCGIVPRIYDLAKLKLQLTLAVSLHAPDDVTRLKLMPVAKSYPVNQLIRAARHYGDFTKRRVTIEYAMISGINDGEDQAAALAGLLGGGMFHVNLIPVNPVKEMIFKPSPRERVNKFAAKLNGMGVETTVRRTLGGSVGAACGQLRNTRAHTHLPAISKAQVIT